jgi:hypothetical protein
MLSEEGPDIEVLDAVVAVMKMLSGALAQSAADDPVGVVPPLWVFATYTG